MGTKDFFDLFKLNILKNSWLYFLLICWLVGFAYLPSLLSLLPLTFLVRFQKQLPDVDNWVIPIGVLRFVFWVLTFLVIKELYDRFKDFINRGELYKFTSDSWNKDWIYNGKPKLFLDPLILRVNSSRAGCLYNKSVWKNFEMKFQMQFFSEKPFTRYNYDKYLGLIFRAKDLDNYFMLQIYLREESGNNKFVAIPHVRYQGMWEVMSDEVIGLINNPEPDWFDVKMRVNDCEVRLSIKNVGNFTWRLPTHVDVNHIEDGIKKSENNLPKDNAGETFGAKISSLPEINFRDSFGMIGFRAYLNEGADVKKLEVKRI